VIIVRVPFRVSLFGGGTDFKEFFAKRKCNIISFSIDKYCYINVRRLLPYFNTRYRISWSKIEEVSSIDKITHPSIKACLKYLDIADGLEIHTVGDLPARSGLGSSSSFTAALLSALYLYKNETFKNSEIAEKTIHIEQNILKENVGLQDQIQVCHGGFNITTIFPDSKYSTLSLNNTSSFVRQINESLILVYSGITRISSDIHTSNKKIINKSVYKSSLDSIAKISDEFSELLLNHNANLDIFSDFMKKSWSSKCNTFPESKTTSEILEIYNKGIHSGALCGKLLGAGGGGFFAFFVPKESQQSFLYLMKDHICVSASIAFSGIEKIHHDNI
tara:strand:- start:3241 stop:4239 length:999 start_codon:yes stop_codon:yes gene_type:complete